MKTALLLSHSRDVFTIDRVAAWLQEEGVKVIRFNTDLFPESIKINERVNSSGSSVQVQLEDGIVFNTKDIGVVWHRKIWKPIIKTPMDEQFLNASIKESTAVRTAFFQSIQDLPWLDAIPQVVKASDKYHQLRLAQSVGLVIPRTIISNDAEAVKSFYKELKGGMIGKLHMALSTSMEGGGFSFYTTKIEEENLDELDSLSICPMIFQELIPKAYELRVAYVDGQCFAGKIETGAVIDWRKPGMRFTWEAYEINQDLNEKLKKIMDKLGLSFGAIDLIVQPDGTYVFLEVNPVGEWGMLEKELELPISKAIAEGLINRLS